MGLKAFPTGKYKEHRESTELTVLGRDSKERLENRFLQRVLFDFSETDRKMKDTWKGSRQN